MPGITPEPSAEPTAAGPHAFHARLLGRGQFEWAGEPWRPPYAKAQALLLLLPKLASSARSCASAFAIESIC